MFRKTKSPKCIQVHLSRKTGHKKSKNWTEQRGIYSTVHLTISLWRRELLSSAAGACYTSA